MWFLFDVPNPPKKEAALGDNPHLEAHGVRLAFDNRYVVAFCRYNGSYTHRRQGKTRAGISAWIRLAYGQTTLQRIGIPSE